MNEAFVAKSTEEINPETIESKETFNHLDVGEVMKEYNAYFVHTIQVDSKFDVSENNQAIDTNKLSVSDKLDILYATNPSISTSTLRPNTLDGTFRGGLGVVLSAGEITSAHRSDVGSKAVSINERVVGGNNANEPEDVEGAINRNYLVDKSYNEIAVKGAEVAGGFLKLDKSYDVSYVDFERDYGPGGGVVTEKIGQLNLSNVYNTDRYGNPNPKDAKKRYDVPFNIFRDMELRGPVFVMDENNQLFLVSDIDVENRIISFSTKPFTPADVAEVLGNKYISSEKREELIDGLMTRGVMPKQ